MKSWKFMMFAGLVSLFGGALALNNPIVTSLTLEQLIGWTCLVSGVFTLISAITNKHQRGMSIIMGLLALIFGYFFIRLPMESLLSFTSFIIMLLMMSAVSQLVMAFSNRQSYSFAPSLISGLISLALAIILIIDFNSSAESLLGIIFAVELISNGISLIALALTFHRSPNKLVHT